MSDHPRTAPARKSIWRSKLLLGAIAITLLGVALWAYALATRPEPAQLPPDSSRSALVSGFASGDPNAPAPQAAPKADPRLVDEAAPAVARFGGSFIAGFCIAYALRKFIKIGAFVVGTILIGLFALNYFGVVDVNTQLITDSLENAVAWVRGEAGAVKDVVLGYLPSAGAGATGLIVGARKG